MSSDVLMDLAARLPWADAVFDTILSEHVIEHLDLEAEGLPFLGELHRVAKPGAVVWLSTPDIEQIVASHLADRGASLRDSWCARNPAGHLPSVMPPVQMLNRPVHHSGEHKNLFDFDLLQWACGRRVL